MIRVRQIKIDAVNNDMNELLLRTSKILRINVNEIKEYKIIKKSLDARKKGELYFVYDIDVKVLEEDKILNKINNINVLKTPKEEYEYKVTGNISLNNKIVIVGAGPAGLFCAYMLTLNGYKPLIIDRGKEIDERNIDVDNFWNHNILNEESNVLYGEGGAGLFSDGKLNTLVKDKRFMLKKVFEIFVENGANEEIMYDYKPHIGSDKLKMVIKNIRNKIIKNGGEFRFNSCLTDIIIKNNKVTSIIINEEEQINTDVLVLAIGHSPEDTFNMLYKRKLNITSKPFAVGIRIQHNQSDINYAQLGSKYIESIGAMNYKLTYNTDKRGIYTFCMCPGGYVVNSSNKKGYLSINGMSNYKRDTLNANSAIIVTVNKDDFGDKPLDGIKFQQQLEKKAYDIGKGKIPTQKYIDYKNNELSTSFGSVNPIFKGDYTLANINEIFPDYINSSLKEAIENFGKKIKGFNCDDAIISAVESKTSSPIKIVRDENLESNIKGIYPCGEGSGYAGGITTSAMDGIKVFESITKIYKN